MAKLRSGLAQRVGGITSALLSLAAVLPSLLLASPAPASAREPDEDVADAPRLIDPRIDARGRDTRVWPPCPHFDFQHLRLELDIPNMQRPALRGVAVHSLAAVGNPRKSLTLRAGPALTVSEVHVNAASAPFLHDKTARTLTITPAKPFQPGVGATVEIRYTAIRPGGGGAGLTFSGDDRRTPEVDYQCHAQGQPESNSLWFPCHDFPNDRLSTELIVTVPSPYEAISNGRLVSVKQRPIVGELPDVLDPSTPDSAPTAPDTATEASDDVELDPPARSAATLPEKPPEILAIEADDPGRKPPTHAVTYHWRQDLPHPVYLVTLIVGRFDVVNVGGPDSARPGLWMPAYGPLGSEEATRLTFKNTPAMMAHFEQLFGLTYPWDKYAQIICRDFEFGAMENTGAVTFSSSMAPSRRPGSIDDVIAHELVHHWFGDLVTCRSWEHLWLNEGWATFGEALWVEKLRGRDGYQAAILRNVGAERATSRDRDSPRRVGMASHRYADPKSRFLSADNVYQKGGVVLHMLRQRLGDEVFFDAVRQYLRDHLYGQVESDDFRVSLEAASGQSLERFFHQWCVRPGHPQLQLDYSWTPADPASPDGPGTLTVAVEQDQTINADNPAYALNLPFYIRFDQPRRRNRSTTGNTNQDAAQAPPPDAAPRATNTWLEIAMTSRQTSSTIELSAKPLRIEVDPDLTVLSRNRVRTPLATAGASATEIAAARLADLDDLAMNGSTYHVRWQAGQHLLDIEARDAAASARQEASR
jgi:aminopeptidase N